MKKIFIIFLFLGILLNGCDFGDFGDINIDPNNPSSTDTRFLYVYAVRQAIPTFYMTGTYDPWTVIYPQYISERSNIQFTTFLLTTFGTNNYYSQSLKNLNKIIEFNTDADTKNENWVTLFNASNDNQIALARTLKAYIYMHLTDALGMLPYSEALKATEGLYKPKYDDQQSIYTDLNKELEEAFAQFNVNIPFDDSYEILYNGDVSKWKKFNASVRMQLAIKLFKADENTGKTRFAKAFNDGFIRSNADIFSYKYLSESTNENPLYNNIEVSRRRDFSPSGVFVDSLISYNDPRLTVYADKNKFGTYYGMPFGLVRANALLVDPDTISAFHPNYYKQNSPAVLVTPSIMLLAAAEAAERGWISASSENLYNEAIVAAFNQHGLGDEIDEYMNQEKVKFNTGGTSAERIVQIAMQKWLASFLQDSFEAWADWRRLGVPYLKPGPSATIAEIPRRRYYDSGDYNANKDNRDAAVAVQGADNFFTRVWWDKP